MNERPCIQEIRTVSTTVIKTSWATSTSPKHRGHSFLHHPPQSSTKKPEKTVRQFSSKERRRNTVKVSDDNAQVELSQGLYCRQDWNIPLLSTDTSVSFLKIPSIYQYCTLDPQTSGTNQILVKIKVIKQ